MPYPTIHVKPLNPTAEEIEKNLTPEDGAKTAAGTLAVFDLLIMDGERQIDLSTWHIGSPKTGELHVANPWLIPDEDLREYAADLWTPNAADIGDVLLLEDGTKVHVSGRCLEERGTEGDWYTGYVTVCGLDQNIPYEPLTYRLDQLTKE